MKPQYTYTDNNGQKLTLTKVADTYLATFNNKDTRVQIPKEVLEYILTNLEKELATYDSLSN